MKKKILLSLLLATGLTQVAWGDNARERLNNFFTNVTTIQSGFVQEVYGDDGKLRQKSTGHMYVNRPGQFRWEYKSPEPHQIVSDGKKVYVYDVDLDQVTIKPVQKALSAAPVALLMRKQSVDEQFHVQPMKSNGSLNWFHLVPKKKDSDFVSMDLGIDNNSIREMVLQDKFGQETQIHLHGVNIDPKIDPSKFQFTPPQGADVING